jgi:ParB family chromosome partitioning protein
MPTQSRRLGKGLGALLGESAVEAARAETGGPDSGVHQLPIARIRPNRYQPRQSFDEEAIGDLAASIAQKGVLQPLIVTPLGDGDYELVSGERRLRAAEKVGLGTVPVVVRKVDDRELLEIALIENLQREDLDPIEEAAGYRQLVDEFGLTQAQLATELGKSRPAIANALRLLDLPEAVRRLLREGSLSAGHGRALLGLGDAAAIGQAAERAAREGLTVRQVERLVRRAQKEPRPRPAEGTEELERARIEEELQRALGTRVRLRATARGKGRIEIAFHSFDDLERLREILTRTAR